LHRREFPFAGQRIAAISIMDGIRVTVEDGSWGLVRASSNKPGLVVVCESPVSARRMREVFAAIDNLLRCFAEVGEYDQKT
jgi:phosphomannomutase/phosphoglucomutase